MTEGRSGAVTRQQAAVVALTSAALLLLLPTLSGPVGEAPGAVTLTALGLAILLGRLAGLGSWLPALACVLVGARPTAGGPVPPVSAGRATDPAHHPLRPRAPGLV